MHQGEDLGRWVRRIRLGWGCKAHDHEQWMCEHILGIEPAGKDEKPKPRRTQADKWALNYQAAKQYYEREGHLRVPRKHISTHRRRQRQGPGGAGAPTRGGGGEPTHPGRHTDPGTNRAALRHRHAMDS